MEVKLITGGKHEDSRGALRFVNDFDMSSIKRFYTISNSASSPKRGWILHHRETKYFFPLRGVTTIHILPEDCDPNSFAQVSLSSRDDEIKGREEFAEVRKWGDQGLRENRAGLGGAAIEGASEIPSACRASGRATPLSLAFKIYLSPPLTTMSQI